MMEIGKLMFLMGLVSQPSQMVKPILVNINMGDLMVMALELTKMEEPMMGFGKKDNS